MIRMILFLLFILVLSCGQQALLDQVENLTHETPQTNTHDNKPSIIPEPPRTPISDKEENSKPETPQTNTHSPSHTSVPTVTPTQEKPTVSDNTSDYQDVSNTPTAKFSLDLADKKVAELSKKIIQNVKTAKSTSITNVEKVKAANKLRKAAHDLADSLSVIADLKGITQASSITEIDEKIKAELSNTKNDLPESTSDASSINSRIEALRTFYNTLLIEKYNLVQSISAYNQTRIDISKKN
ncbi:hypothetical protein [Borrelia sp. RT1S]|uniref:hypothetical protein n=1 Tax=Borrelia sp. RT1S TaxID=2898580 RepID=UPI001E344E72|nr:hypothetical protein [Borrelia sp. RT1S]UGQ17805.1 hypothetical protein LSO05_05085 [Borrelia sp. RT1S]